MEDCVNKLIEAKERREANETAIGSHGKTKLRERTNTDGDLSNEFPNFAALTKEEKLAFFEALSSARRNVEKTGAQARQVFGTVHDEYLRVFQDGPPQAKKESDEKASSASSSDTEGTYTLMAPPMEDVVESTSDKSIISIPEDFNGDDLFLLDKSSVSDFPVSRNLPEKAGGMVLNRSKRSQPSAITDRNKLSPRTTQIQTEYENVLAKDADKIINMYLKKKKQEEGKFSSGQSKTTQPEPLESRSKPPGGTGTLKTYWNTTESGSESPSESTSSEGTDVSEKEKDNSCEHDEPSIESFRVPKLGSVKTPKFDALNTEEREIFFKILKEAHNNVYQNSRPNEMPRLNSILERYDTDVHALVEDPTSKENVTTARHRQEQEGRKRSKTGVKVKLPSSHNQEQTQKEQARKIKVPQDREEIKELPKKEPAKSNKKEAVQSTFAKSESEDVAQANVTSQKKFKQTRREMKSEEVPVEKNSREIGAAASAAAAAAAAATTTTTKFDGEISRKPKEYNNKREPADMQNTKKPPKTASNDAGKELIKRDATQGKRDEAKSTSDAVEPPTLKENTCQKMSKLPIQNAKDRSRLKRKSDENDDGVKRSGKAHSGTREEKGNVRYNRTRENEKNSTARTGVVGGRQNSLLNVGTGSPSFKWPLLANKSVNDSEASVVSTASEREESEVKMNPSLTDDQVAKGKGRRGKKVHEGESGGDGEGRRSPEPEDQTETCISRPPSKDSPDETVFNCTADEIIGCEKDVSYVVGATVSTSEAIAIGSPKDNRIQKLQKDAKKREIISAPSGSGFFPSRVRVLMDDGIIEKVKDLIENLKAKARRDENPFANEYVQLLLNYVDYLSNILHFMIENKDQRTVPGRTQVRGSLTSPNIYMKFQETATLGPPATDDKPESVNSSSIPEGDEVKGRRCARKAAEGQQEKPPPSNLETGSSESTHASEEEDHNLMVPMYTKKKRLPTTKIRVLQDLLKEKAVFVEGSISDFKIVQMPGRDVDTGTSTARMHLEEQEDARSERTSKFSCLKALAKLCRCGKKEVADEENLLENLKGEAVAVDVSKGTKTPASVTLNESTMEVLKAAQRKKVIEKYWKIS